MLKGKKVIIRTTKSVCPMCIKKINASIIKKDEKIYMFKKCNKHGNFKILLSSYANYYQDLTKLFLKLNPSRKSYKEKQTYYQLFLTQKCNMGCPICYTNINAKNYTEPSLDFIRDKLSHFKNVKIGLYGGEPTLREDLPNVIKEIKKTKNIPILYTNGIKIANTKYLQDLIDCGIEMVHLQFDSFKKESNLKIRKKDVINLKIKALKNLEDLKLPTVLEVAVARNVNENEMMYLLKFAASHRFVRAVFFRACAPLGKNNSNTKVYLTIEDMIKNIETQSEGRVSLEDVKAFQKIFYMFSSLSGVKRCYYNHYYLFFREKDGCVPISDSLNFKKMEKWLKHYENYFLADKKSIANLYFLRGLIFSLKKKYFFSLAKGLFSIWLRKNIIKKRFTGSNFPNNMLIISFANFCDPYILDFDLSVNCVAGEISTNDGVQDIARDGILIREKRYRKIKD